MAAKSPVSTCESACFTAPNEIIVKINSRIIIALSLLILLIPLTGCSGQRQLVDSDIEIDVVAEEAGVTESPNEASSRDPFIMPAQPGPFHQRIIGHSTKNVRDPFIHLPINTVVQETPLTLVEGNISLQLLTSDMCWLEVFVDGEQVVRKNVPAGTLLGWEASRSIRLEQVGREGAVSLTLNGNDLGRLSSLSSQLQSKELVYSAGNHRIRASMERRYDYGVLVGLEFAAIN